LINGNHFQAINLLMKNMTPVWFNRAIKDEQRRERLYAGEIFVYDRVKAVEDLAAFTRDAVEKVLAPHDPRHVHEALSPEDLAQILGKLKPAFIHHAESRRLVTRILAELGVELEDCHMDLPKLRTAYPPGHLTKGIAYAFPGHRDTWYGGPQAQINWWMPVYPLAADNAMAFYPRYFSNPVKNNSDGFNYYRRNAERKVTAQFVKEDPRVQPAALDLGPDEPEFRLLPEVGGIILFSGTQLHATVTSPNCLSRYSIDYRTVSRRDVENQKGAPNIDNRCTGTALRDFRRANDNAAMPEELALLLDPEGPGTEDIAVFKPGA
jgi:hypothetical protein